VGEGANLVTTPSLIDLGSGLMNPITFEF